MDDVRIILSALWAALMLSYLLGDVLRIFAGDFTPGQIEGQAAGPWVWVGAAVVMLVPIAMVVLSLVLPLPAARWIVIAAAVGLAAFNILGVPYPSAFDNLLLAVGIGVNGIIVWLAWRWPVVIAPT